MEQYFMLPEQPENFCLNFMTVKFLWEFKVRKSLLMAYFKYFLKKSCHCLYSWNAGTYN